MQEDTLPASSEARWFGLSLAGLRWLCCELRMSVSIADDVQRRGPVCQLNIKHRNIRPNRFEPESEKTNPMSCNKRNALGRKRPLGNQRLQVFSQRVVHSVFAPIDLEVEQ